MYKKVLHFLKKSRHAYRNRQDIFHNGLADMAEWHYKHSIASDFDIDSFRHDYSKYWAQLSNGLKIPRIEQEYFYKINGIKSEAYLPYGIYYYLVNPYLNRWPFRRAYEDKNMFPVLLRLQLLDETVKIRFPRMVTNCINGKFFTWGGKQCSFSEAAGLLVDFHEDVIVKPTYDTWGNGVMKLKKEEINGDTLQKLLNRYGRNFLIQECVHQHPRMASFNNSSVNTLRVMTYYNSKGRYECLRTIQRFGGEGTVIDNASAGGGFVLVTADGKVQRTKYRMLSTHTETLPAQVTTDIPSYEMIIKATIELHKQLPHFDLVGWDIAVDREGIPVILEYNCVAPSLDLPQIAGGPLFSEEELQAIMPQVFAFKNTPHYFVNQLVWPDKPGYAWCDDYGFYI